MKATIYGFYNKSNIGDEAFKAAFHLLLPGHDLRFSDTVRPDDASDLIILGGGDVALPGFTKQFSPSQTSQTSAVSISVTNGSDFEFLKKCRQVVVRDFASQSLCLEQGVQASRWPDLVYALTADPERGRAWLEEKFKKSSRELYSRVVVCCPNGYTFFGGHDSQSRDLTKALSVADDLAWIFDRLDTSVIFLPFSTQAPADDRCPSYYIESRTKWFKKHLVVSDVLDAQMALDIISACDALVGNRLHSIIMATIGGVPFVAIDHHQKIASAVEEIGHPEWSQKFFSFSRDSVLQLLRDHLSGRSETSSLVDYSDRSRSSILASSLFCVNRL